MKVECYDKEGAEVYDMIVRQILQEVQVTRSISDLRVFVDPREPVFIIVVKFERAAAPILLEDLAECEYDKQAKELFIMVEDETYLPELLQKLWEIEGRNKVHHPSRYEVIVDSPTGDIKKLVVHDPQEDMKKKIYDAVFRIIPEGFRVIEHRSEDDIIAMTCSDELIKDEWLEKTDEIIEELKNE